LRLLLSEPPAEVRVTRLVSIRGSVPRAADVVDSCGFADRCDWAKQICRAGKPPLAPRNSSRFTACIRQDQIQGELDALRTAALSAAPITPRRSETEGALVRVDALVKTFVGRRGYPIRAVKDVSLRIMPGESVGLVGESGSGKTTIGRCLVGLETPTAGDICIDGIAAADFGAMAKADRVRVRRTIQRVFQDPYSTLNPRHRVGQALEEALGASVGSGNPVTPETGRGVAARCRFVCGIRYAPSVIALRRRAPAGGHRARACCQTADSCV
jgi:peptide/nickel transport system ATP-binding protein